MTDATYFDVTPVRSVKPAREGALPAPQPFAPPVFIHDCATPLAGETLLSLLMKRMVAEKEL